MQYHHLLCLSAFIQRGLLGKESKLNAIFMCSLVHSGKHFRASFSFLHFWLETDHFFLLQHAKELHGSTRKGGFLAKITLLQTLGDGKLVSAVDVPTESFSVTGVLLPLLSFDSTRVSSSKPAS